MSSQMCGRWLLCMCHWIGVHVSSPEGPSLALSVCACPLIIHVIPQFCPCYYNPLSLHNTETRLSHPTSRPGNGTNMPSNASCTSSRSSRHSRRSLRFVAWCSSACPMPTSSVRLCTAVTMSTHFVGSSLTPTSRVYRGRSLLTSSTDSERVAWTGWLPDETRRGRVVGVPWPRGGEMGGVAALGTQRVEHEQVDRLPATAPRCEQRVCLRQQGGVIGQVDHALLRRPEGEAVADVVRPV